MKKKFCLKVWGDYACFTRPEMKAERVSYDIITPSAARAIFEAILWKPEISWAITRIDVLNPIKWVSLRRNELGSKVPVGSVRTVMNRGKGKLAQYIESDRQQRAGLILKDVAYLLHAELNLKEQAASENSIQKYAAMFQRRAEKGQCILQPYFGCREFSAHFELQSLGEQLPEPFPVDRDFGWILYDMDFSGKLPAPMFFRAEVKNGSLSVPRSASSEVRR